MTRAFLGLGSNLGNKVGNIRRAIVRLKENESIHKVDVSSFYKTDPMGITEQDWFVNVVVRLDTSLSARQLLDFCLSVEGELKRVRGERWGPRTLDMDILLFGDQTIREAELEVPHPRIHERAFVMAPLFELEPQLEWKGRSLKDCLDAVGLQGVERMSKVVAVMGASEKSDRYANRVQKALMESGYKLALVAPRGERILGVPVIRSLQDCVDPVDTVTLYIGTSRVPAILDDLLETMPGKVIFNPGTENVEVRERLEAAGIETLEACTLVMLRTGRFYSSMM